MEPNWPELPHQSALLMGRGQSDAVPVKTTSALDGRHSELPEPEGQRRVLPPAPGRAPGNVTSQSEHGPGRMSLYGRLDVVTLHQTALFRETALAPQYPFSRGAGEGAGDEDRLASATRDAEIDRF